MLTQSKNLVWVPQLGFQQDYDAKHTSKEIKKKFSNQARINEQSSQKSDMNPVENMWTVLMKPVSSGRQQLYFKWSISVEVSTLRTTF